MMPINPSLFFLVLVCLSFTQLQAQDVRFKLEVKNCIPGTIFSISRIDNLFTGEERAYQFTLNDCEKYVSLPIQKAGAYKLTLEQQSLQLWVAPGFEPVLSFDATDIRKSIQITGKGAGEMLAFARNPSPFQTIEPSWSYRNQLLPTNFDAGLVGKAESLEKNAYNSWVKQQSNKAKNQLQHNGAPSEANRYLKVGILYDEAAYQLLYFLSREWEYAGADFTNELQPVLQRASVNDVTLLEHPAYIRFLSVYTLVMSMKDGRYSDATEYDLYPLIEQLFSGRVREFMLARLFYNTYLFSDNELIRARYSKFKRNCTTKAYTDALDALFGPSLSFDEEGMAPAFSLPDESGNLIALSDYKGKVVYLSFWATWCKPCLAGFEKSRYIREEMIKKGVVLINISVDRDPTTWKQTMSRVPMPGINLLSADNGILRTYNISALPVYHIVDKLGNFTYLPEGSRDVLEEFERMVKE